MKSYVSVGFTATALAASTVTVAAVANAAPTGPSSVADRDRLVTAREQLIGAHWYSGTPEEAGQHEVDPRMYQSMRDWMDAYNLRGYMQDSLQKHPPQGYELPRV
jgi:hypothetical protein